MCGKGVPVDFYSKKDLWDMIKRDIPFKERERLIHYDEHHSKMIEILNEKWSSYVEKNLFYMRRNINEIAEDPVKVTAEHLNL